MDSGADPSDPSDTGSVPSGPAVLTAVSCSPQPTNVLRYDCQLRVRPPGSVTLRFTAAGEPPYDFVSTESSGSHEITLWGMTPEATHGWEAWADDTPDTRLSGQLTTAALPTAFQLVVNRVERGTYGTEWVMFNVGCQHSEALVVIDDLGQVAWYQDILDIPSPVPLFSYRGYAFTADHTVLAVAHRQWVVEFDLAGHILLQAGVPDGRLPSYPHHDVQRHGDHTYVLVADEVPYPDGSDYVMDSVVVLDRAGDQVDRWDLAEIVDPQGAPRIQSGYWALEFPGAVDFGHANALAPTADAFFVSLRHLHAVVKLSGRPGSPAFGDREWTLAGAPESYLESDLVLTSAGEITDDLEFRFQHHVSAGDDGLVSIFDNGEPPENARGLDLAIDEGEGTADIVGEWRTGRICVGQGSHFRLPNGNTLMDCADDRLLMEVEPTGRPVLELQPLCRSGGPAWVLYRGVPVDLRP